MKATVYPPFEKGGHEKFMPVETESDDHAEACEELSVRFNHAHPGVTGQDAEKFKCRSMSVGDMVWFVDKRFVCCGLDWREIDALESDEILRMDFKERSLKFSFVAG